MSPKTPVIQLSASFSENEEILAGLLMHLELLQRPNVYSFDVNVTYNGCAYSFFTKDPFLCLLLCSLGSDEGRGIFAEVLREELVRLGVLEMVIADRVGIRMIARHNAYQFELSLKAND